MIAMRPDVVALRMLLLQVPQVPVPQLQGVAAAIPVLLRAIKKWEIVGVRDKKVRTHFVLAVILLQVGLHRLV